MTPFLLLVFLLLFLLAELCLARVDGLIHFLNDHSSLFSRAANPLRPNGEDSIEVDLSSPRGLGGERERQELEDALGPILCRLPFAAFDSRSKLVAKAIDLRNRNGVVVDLVGVFFLRSDYGTVPR